jgi:hypothetical protein
MSRVENARALSLSALLIALALAPPLGAQAPGDAEAFRASVQEMMRLTGSTQLGEQVANSVFRSVVASMRQTNPELPPRVSVIAEEVASETFGALFSDEKRLLDLYAPLYERHFSQAELDEIIRFYRTPVGQKAIRAMPSVLQEAMQVSQQWVQEATPRFTQELARRLEAEGLATQ